MIMKAYPDWFYPIILISLFTLVMTGLLLIPVTLIMRFEWDVLWKLNGGVRLFTVASHTLSSYLILMMVGALSPIHMRAGISRKKNKRSGFSLIAIFFTLTLTGLGLLYLASNALILLASIVHVVIGIVLVVVFMVHFVKNKRIKKPPT
jgi:heme A synthase